MSRDAIKAALAAANNGTAVAQEAAAAPNSRAPRKGSALTAAAPPNGGSQDALLAWLTAQLRLPSPVTRVQRWGSSAVSPVVLLLEDGRKIRFAEAAHIMDGSKLVQGVVLALGTSSPQLPVLSRGDAQDVFSVAVRACDLAAVDDEVARTGDWLDGLTRVVRELHHGDYADPAARWAGLCWLAHEPDFDPRAHHLAAVDARYGIPVVVWADGAHYVRVTDVERYIRRARPSAGGPADRRTAARGWLRSPPRRGPPTRRTEDAE